MIRPFPQKELSHALHRRRPPQADYQRVRLVRDAGKRRVIARRSLRCDQPRQIRTFFARLKPFQLTVEATSSYEWFVELVEPLAHRIVLGL